MYCPGIQHNPTCVKPPSIILRAVEMRRSISRPRGMQRRLLAPGRCGSRISIPVTICFETELKTGRVSSTKRYFVRFRLEPWQQDERVLAHDYCAEGREVLIRFPVDTLDDVLGWFPYAVKFKEHHGCRLTCAISRKPIALFRDEYCDITFMTEEEAKPECYYATYTIAVYFREGAVYEHKGCVPCEFWMVGLHRAAGYIDPTEMPLRMAIPDRSRP